MQLCTNNDYNAIYSQQNDKNSLVMESLFLNCPQTLKTDLQQNPEKTTNSVSNKACLKAKTLSNLHKVHILRLLNTFAHVLPQ